VPGDIEHNTKHCFQKEVWAAELFVAAKQLIKFYNITYFDVSLTVHLSIFILVINQLDAQNLFHNKFISSLYVFRVPCANRQEVNILLYSLHRTATYRCDHTRGCIIKF